MAAHCLTHCFYLNSVSLQRRSQCWWSGLVLSQQRWLASVHEGESHSGLVVYGCLDISEGSGRAILLPLRSRLHISWISLQHIPKQVPLKSESLQTEAANMVKDMANVLVPFIERYQTRHIKRKLLSSPNQKKLPWYSDTR